MSAKNSFIKNTLILFSAMFITKIIGAVLKIPLANMLGGTGMGYFSTAYSLFNPVYTVLAAGLPTIVTKLTAQSAACRKYKEARKIKKASLIISVIMGVFGTAFMFIFAKPFADFAASSPDSIWSIFMISPSVLFCCVAAAYRGYYEGMSNMMPTAFSQVIESVIKAFLGLLLSWTVISMGNSGIIASEKVLPLAAAAAVLGVTVGELFGTLFLMFRSKFGTDGITETELAQSSEPSKSSVIIRKIIFQSLPISFGAVIISLGSFIDLLTISGGIQETYVLNRQFFISQYPLVFYEGVTENFGNFVYGSYTGIVLSLFMIITSLTSLIGKSALPVIAAEYEKNKQNEVCRQINILFSGIFIVGLPLCFSLGVLAEPVLSLLYPSRMAEVSVSIMPLAVLCVGGISVAVCGGLFSVFQAIGRTDLPIKLMMICSVIKLLLNVIFLHIPFLSVSGAAISTIVSHIFVMIIGVSCLNKAVGMKCGMIRIFAVPALAAALCAVAAAVSYYVLFDKLSEIIKMCLTVLFGGTVYSALIVIMDRRIVSALISRLKRKRYNV